MKVLLSNDDGIEAPGLHTLAQVCESLGWQVVVVAPHQEQSGVGHRVTAHAPLVVSKRQENWYSVEGTPADCTRLGLTELATDIDWVLAGINQGGNLGADVYISGTIAAARESAFLGTPALALSQYVSRHRPLDWKETAVYARLVLQHLPRWNCESGAYYSANFPHAQKPIDPVEKTPLVPTKVDDHPLPVQFEKTSAGYRYRGVYADRPRRPGHDVEVCFAGSIAVSKLSLPVVPAFDQPLSGGEKLE